MRKVTVYRTSFTDVEDGEYVDPDTDEEITECEPDEHDRADGVTAVDLAVTAIGDAGCSEPSTMPGFHPGIWYSDPDGSYTDYRTGERVATSAHLDGFTEEEEREIHARITG